MTFWGVVIDPTSDDEDRIRIRQEAGSTVSLTLNQLSG